MLREPRHVRLPQLQFVSPHLFLSITCPAGISAKQDNDMNSLAVPRKAQEAIGGIACSTHRDKRKMTVNGEYNQLDPLPRATTHPDGSWFKHQKYTFQEKVCRNGTALLVARIHLILKLIPMGESSIKAKVHFPWNSHHTLLHDWLYIALATNKHKAYWPSNIIAGLIWKQLANAAYSNGICLAQPHGWAQECASWWKGFSAMSTELQSGFWLSVPSSSCNTITSMPIITNIIPSSIMIIINVHFHISIFE